jgi:hypothetical protein
MQFRLRKKPDYLGKINLLPIVLGYIAVAIAWFLVNTGTLSLAVSLASGRSILSVWREGLSLVLLNFFCSAAAAGLLSILFQKNRFSSFFLCIPIAVGVYQLYSFYVQRFQTQISTLLI